jgi:hypothetical protein
MVLFFRKTWRKLGADRLKQNLCYLINKTAATTQARTTQQKQQEAGVAARLPHQ